MRAVYANPQHTTIYVALGSGEQLGDIVGPAETMVPVDAGNATYVALLALQGAGQTIWDHSLWNATTPLDPDFDMGVSITQMLGE